MKPKKICTSNDRIRELLDETGISQTDFCKRTGINKSALSNYLKGDRVPRQDQLSKIADAFNVSAAWLMGYDIPKRDESELLFYDESDPQKPHLAYYAAGDRLALYTQLLDEAHGLTPDQVRVAIDTLRSLNNLNKKED